MRPEGWQPVTNGGQDAFGCSLCRFAQERFELYESILDGV
jgi:hypothetical protein